MEKQRIFTITKSFKRLLNFFCLSLIFTLPAFSKTLTQSQMNAIKITPSEKQNMYVRSEIKFEAVLPEVESSSVQVQIPEAMENVTFKTLRKTETFTDKAGTKIELWFTFDKKGTYNMKPLTVVLNGKQRTLGFAPVTINNNPASMNSRMVIKFDNGYTVYSDEGVSEKYLFEAAAGKKISYTIYLQYTVQLIQFSWDLPKDSILKQIKTYDITESRYSEKKLSEELIPVASYEWESLTEGIQSMPPVRLVATGYNGYRNTILMPDFKIKFSKSNRKDENVADALFVEAFNTNYIHANDDTHISLSDEICETLASLRHQERTNFWNHSISKKNRIAFEQAHNLPVYEDEFFNGIFILSAALFIILAVLFFVFLKFKKQIAQLLSATALVCALVLLIYSVIQVNKSFGIIKNTQLYSIPEKSATASNEISAGTRVRIIEKTEEWYYVEVGDFGGWVQKSFVYEI